MIFYEKLTRDARNNSNKKQNKTLEKNIQLLVLGAGLQSGCRKILLTA